MLTGNGTITKYLSQVVSLRKKKNMKKKILQYYPGGLLIYTRRFSNHESRLLSRSHTFAIIVIFNRFENTSKYVDTLTLFSKNLNQRSLTPRWPLTPCLLRSHVWLYPRIIVSKSHDDTSMYVDTVINFANYHIHTYTYYVHTTYYVQNEWSHSLLLNSVQARQKGIKEWAAEHIWVFYILFVDEKSLDMHGSHFL